MWWTLATYLLLIHQNYWFLARNTEIKFSYSNLNKDSLIDCFFFAGYYVEKDVESAKEYFTKKVKYVTEQMEKVQGIGNEKAKIREAVMDVMEQKLQVQFAQQQSGAKAVKWWYSIVMFFLSHKYTVHKTQRKTKMLQLSVTMMSWVRVWVDLIVY